MQCLETIAKKVIIGVRRPSTLVMYRGAVVRPESSAMGLSPKRTIYSSIPYYKHIMGLFRSYCYYFGRFSRAGLDR